jgi:hypothetical protein
VHEGSEVQPQPGLIRLSVRIIALAADLRTVITSTTRSRFIRNWSMLVFSNIACQALGIVATARIARYLLPLGYGQYNLMQRLARVYNGL